MKDQQKLAAIECHEPWQALLCLPKGHVDKRGAYAAIGRAPRGRLCLLKAQAVSAVGYNRNNEPTYSPFPSYIKVQLEFEDETLFARFYRAKPEEFQELIGGEIVFESTVEDLQHTPYLRSSVLATVTGRIEPIYTGLQGLVSGDVVQDAVKSVVDDEKACARAIAAIEANHAVMQTLAQHRRSPTWLLTGLHRPLSLCEADEALYVARQACINEVKCAARPSRAQLPTPYSLDDALKALVVAQPETLSESQRRALNVIRKACNAQRPSHILLNGDVGSGKTLVFLLALAAIAQASQGKVAVMVPSDLVARQIHANAVQRFPEMAPCLISGDATVDASPEQVARSRMFIGTQALLSRDLPPLEALVVDEQHKLSVAQRSALLKHHTHIIESSATPIPRTLALALYDGWTYAVIRHSPVEKTIRSHVFDPDGRDEVSRMVRGHLSASRKVIFLYPSVGQKKDISVSKKSEALMARFPGKVAMLHGKLKSGEKVLAIESFRSGVCPIIVASTAIEVGVDVPDVGMMVVSGADRFGASQLHQLRGRLVRNGGVGDFVMIVPKSMSASTRKRLEAVAEHSDGFALAQKDLELRGFGELLGEMQTGSAYTLFKLSRLTPADFLSG